MDLHEKHGYELYFFQWNECNELELKRGGVKSL